MVKAVCLKVLILAISQTATTDALAVTRCQIILGTR
jgi:hypothetical protein